MQERTRALYLRCSAGHALVCWLAIGLNVACMLAFAAWLWAHAADVRPSWILLGAAGVSGLLGADVFSGLVHWASDTWLDERTCARLGSIVREHHTHPLHLLDYGFRDYAAYMSLPSVVVLLPTCALTTLALPPSGGVYFVALTCAFSGLLVLFGTHFHRLGHERSRSRLVRLLQRGGFLITPHEHARHHRGAHDTHYCVVTGWMNPVLDTTRFFRGLERAISALTGAVPRSRDALFLEEHRRRTSAGERGST